MDNIYEKFSVEELAKSNIPNLIFVYQFINIAGLSVDMKYWEKCIDILICRGHEKVKDVELIMFIWLQDMNWSGSIKVFNYFLSLEIEELNNAFMDAFQLAYIQNDVEWALNLWNILLNKKNGNMIKDNILDNIELSHFLEKILYEK